MRDLGLVTVCEEAGCPNIYECWGQDGTATFMINGERCTRACGFCLVDTRHPEPLDPGEPERVAEAVERMGLGFAVVTAVARDDLADGGASGFADTISAHPAAHAGRAGRGADPRLQGRRADRWPRSSTPGPTCSTTTSRPCPACSGPCARRRATPAAWRCWPGPRRPASRPSPASSSAWARPTTRWCRRWPTCAAVGVDIVTIGQYLRPTTHHLPVARWVEPAVFEHYARAGEAMGIPHVESSPLTRSSYHARQAAGSTAPARPPRPATRPDSPLRRLGGCSPHALIGSAPAWPRWGSTSSASRSAPTCPTSPATRPCRSSASRCWCCPATATPRWWCRRSRRRAWSSAPTCSPSARGARPTTPWPSSPTSWARRARSASAITPGRGSCSTCRSRCRPPGSRRRAWSPDRSGP